MSVIGVVFGNVVHDWWDWLSDAVFGLSIYQVADYVKAR